MHSFPCSLISELDLRRDAVEQPARSPDEDIPLEYLFEITWKPSRTKRSQWLTSMTYRMIFKRLNPFPDFEYCLIFLHVAETFPNHSKSIVWALITLQELRFFPNFKKHKFCITVILLVRNFWLGISWRVF